MEYHLQWFFMCAIIAAAHVGVDLCWGHTSQEPSYRIFVVNDTEMDCDSAYGYQCNCERVHDEPTGSEPQHEIPHVVHACELNSSIELSSIVTTLNCCDNQVQTVEVHIVLNTTSGTLNDHEVKFTNEMCTEEPVRLNTTNPVFVDSIVIHIVLPATVASSQKDNDCFEIPFSAVELFQETCSTSTNQEIINSTTPTLNEEENATNQIFQRSTIITASAGGGFLVCFTTIILIAITVKFKRKKTVRFFRSARNFEDNDYEVTNEHYRDSVVIPASMIISQGPNGNAPQTDPVYELPQECLSGFRHSSENRIIILESTPNQLKDDSNEPTSYEDPSNFSIGMSENVDHQDSCLHNASGSPAPPSYDDAMKQDWRKSPPMQHQVTTCLSEDDQDRDEPVEEVVQQVNADDEVTPSAAVTHMMEGAASCEDQETNKELSAADGSGVVSEGCVVVVESKSKTVTVSEVQTSNMTGNENSMDTPDRETSEEDGKET